VRHWKGGDTVEPGFYWSRGRWEIVTAGPGRSVLAGGPADAYLEVPAPAAIAIAPAMGALFALFLPFIGFAMVFRELVAGSFRAVRGGEAAAARKPEIEI
jgi:hypothetical protein